jgi:hypothetical protein
MSGNRYQDEVIKNVELTVNFENLYMEFLDPWNQSTRAQRQSATRVMTLFYVDKLQDEFKSAVILEIGSGLGWLTEDLYNRGFKASGTDVSPTCILNALELSPDLDLLTAYFQDESQIIDFRPDEIVMNQLSWYILPNLTERITLVRKLAAFGKPTSLIHSLAAYPDGMQSSGKFYFTNWEEIKSFFGLNYQFSMEAETLEEESRYFDTMLVLKS